MVFGLFARKSTQGDGSTSPEPKTVHQHARLPTPTPSIASVAHRSPLRFSTTIRSTLGGSATDSTLNDSDLATESVAEGGSHIQSPAPPPPETPSPPPVDTKALYDLVLTVPPKILHAYTLAHLRPLPPVSTSSPAPALQSGSISRPPSPNSIAKLTAFFSTLAPPPLLHCMRCHKDFYDVENEDKDKACRVPHDDESALVSRVSGGGGGYETLWSCCGQTASGDGSEGPPDGWCYEGRHTTDIKRARFRADSTIHDDKLMSCLKLNCRGIRDQLPRPDRTLPFRNAGSSSARKSNPSPVRSQTSRSTRKRPHESLQEASGSENEADTDSMAGRSAKAKLKEKSGGNAGDGGKDTSMAVDEPNPPVKTPTKIKSRPISRARPPVSTTTTSTSLPASKTNATPAPRSKARAATAKPKSTSHTMLSQSRTHLASDSEASIASRPRTRSLVREESRSRTTSRLTRAGLSERARRIRKGNQPLSQSEEEPEAATDNYEESDQEGRGRDRKKRRLRRD